MVRTNVHVSSFGRFACSLDERPICGFVISKPFRAPPRIAGFEVVEVTKVQRFQEVREPGLVEMDFDRLKPVNIDLRKLPPAVVPRNVPKVNLLEIPSIEKDGPAFQQPNRHQHVDFLLVDALPMRIELAAPASAINSGEHITRIDVESGRGPCCRPFRATVCGDGMVLGSALKSDSRSCWPGERSRRDGYVDDVWSSWSWSARAIAFVKKGLVRIRQATTSRRP